MPSDEFIQIAINIRNMHFHERNFVERVPKATDSYSIDPSLLNLVIDEVKELRKLVVKSLVEDFLYYLKKRGVKILISLAKNFNLEAINPMRRNGISVCLFKTWLPQVSRISRFGFPARTLIEQTS